MARTQTKRGVTISRIYKLLHRNPDMTTNEVAAHLPDATMSMVQTSISRMFKRGQIGSRGKKYEVGPTGRMVPHKTYHVKYNYQPAAKPKPAQKPKVRRAPIVEAPKIVHTTIETVVPRVDAKVQTAYERLAMLHTETMLELAAEKKKVHLCDSWWCRLKRKFS